ncbi:MAG TPA: helix-turn-helix domain-containing protein [Acidimicrobiales bacterium]|nr:helix-turn-helix domain-containing protein [Acidimicrobiales bacterium]
MPDLLAERVIGLPAPGLRPLVSRYVGYRRKGFAPRLHRGLPSRHVTLIISLAAPVHVAALPGPVRPGGGHFAALAGGLHAAPVTITMDGQDHGLHLEVTPAGARALLGLPAGAIAWEVVDLADLFGPHSSALVDRLAATPTWTDRFAILDEMLARRAAQGARVPEAIDWAWRRLVVSGGLVPVSELAEEIGWSRRHLSERFRDELGLSPKVAGRVIRFGRACRLLERSRRSGLAGIAAACGYYDQSHLTREWHELAGCTPTVWMTEELPSVQDATGDGDARCGP